MKNNFKNKFPKIDNFKFPGFPLVEIYFEIIYTLKLTNKYAWN